MPISEKTYDEKIERLEQENDRLTTKLFMEGTPEQEAAITTVKAAGQER